MLVRAIGERRWQLTLVDDGRLLAFGSGRYATPTAALRAGLEAQLSGRPRVEVEHRSTGGWVWHLTTANGEPFLTSVLVTNERTVHDIADRVAEEFIELSILR